MKKLNKKGFTLTEMIVVIAIIAILAAILIPSVTKYINDARRNADYTEAASAYEMYNVKAADVYDGVEYVYYVGSNGYYFFWDKEGKVYFDLNDDEKTVDDVTQSVSDVITFEEKNYNKVESSIDSRYLTFYRIDNTGSALFLDNNTLDKSENLISYELVD